MDTLRVLRGSSPADVALAVVFHDVESGRTFEHQIDTILHYVDHRDLEDVDLIASMVMQDLDEFLLAR